MHPIRIALSVGCLCCLLFLPGCGKETAPPEGTTTETTDRAPLKQTPSKPEEADSTASTSTTDNEPVDPQAEVKAVFQKLLAIRTEPDPDEWQAADKQLVEFGKTAVPTLTKELSSADPAARELASMYLAGLGPEAKPAAVALVSVLQDESPFTQVNAASTLTHFPEHRAQAVPVLIALTTHDDPNTRLTAVYALGNLEAPSEELLTALQTALDDPNSDVQLAAVKVLGQIGQPAKGSLTELQSLIDSNETSESLRSAALTSKEQIEKSLK